MNRQVALIAIAIAAILAGLLAIVSWQRDEPGDTAAGPAGTEAPEAGDAAAAGEMLAMELYFPGTGSWLVAERRELPPGADSVERISTVVETLLAGPRGNGMRAPFADGVSVKEVYLAEDGLVFLDFESPESAPPASGSLREMLTVYSLVNTVLLNFEDLDRVVLLWNGRQRRTFAGHVDTMRPLVARSDLIARSRPSTGEQTEP